MRHAQCQLSICKNQACVEHNRNGRRAMNFIMVCANLPILVNSTKAHTCYSKSNNVRCFPNLQNNLFLPILK